MSSLSWIDGLVAFCLVMPAIRGWQSGIVPGLLRLGGLVAGAAAGWTFADVLAPLILKVFENLPLAAMPWICAALSALVGWNLGTLVGWLWRRSTKDDPLGWIDRVAGMFLGLAKGAAFVLVLLSAIQTALPGMRAQIRSSFVGSHAVAPMVESLATWGMRQLRDHRGSP